MASYEVTSAADQSACCQEIALFKRTFTCHCYHGIFYVFLFSHSGESMAKVPAKVHKTSRASYPL